MNALIRNATTPLPANCCGNSVSLLIAGAKELYAKLSEQIDLSLNSEIAEENNVERTLHKLVDDIGLGLSRCVALYFILLFANELYLDIGS